jgi:hypothetical protein
MTVLVVVLLCTFAAIKKPENPPSPKDLAPAGNKGESKGSRLPLKTPEEYTKAVLAGRRSCVLGALRRGSFEVKVCSYLPESAESGSPNECLSDLKRIIAGFDHVPTFESLESRYSVRFGRIYLRANTGLGSSDSDALKRRLHDEQDYLKTLKTGPFAQFAVSSPTYGEHGPSTLPSESTFGIEVGLSPDLIARIDELWKSADAKGLEELLGRSTSCDRIGN